MIVTEFYSGQGLGNQLWCYVTCRVIALDKGYAFGIESPENFKGIQFLKIDFGECVIPRENLSAETNMLPSGIDHAYNEQQTYDQLSGMDISDQDPMLYSIADKTKISGNFQNEQFIKHRKSLIREWLKIDESLEHADYANDNLCIINFRGGEYLHTKNVFLPKSYWWLARSRMLAINPTMKFIIVTDDPYLARKFFPSDEVHDAPIWEDYLAISTAKYLILSNSSFAWFPAWLNENVIFTIAPKYWWGFNGNNRWSCAYNITSEWTYLDLNGRFFSYSECLSELDEVNQERLQFSNFFEQNHNPERFLLMKIYLLNILQRMKLLGVRRRKSRLLVWFRIIARKLIGKKIFNHLHNRFINFQKMRDYGRNERKFFLNRLRRSLPDKVKVIDSFYFLNEFEIAEIRFETLFDYVDLFLVVEARQTFSGIPKPLYFKENMQRFSKYLDKIVYFEIPIAPQTRNIAGRIVSDPMSSILLRTIAARTLTDANVPGGDTHWITEFFQKESLLLALANFDGDDIIYISDVDEIWNPEKLIRPHGREIFVYKQKPCIYLLNNLSDEHWHNWTGTAVTRLDFLRTMGVNAVRTHRRLPRKVIVNGGWHFSFQGGAVRILEKLNSYGHQELNTSDVKENLIKNIKELEDIRNTKANFSILERGLPAYLKTFRETHEDWFR